MRLTEEKELLRTFFEDLRVEYEHATDHFRYKREQVSDAPGTTPAAPRPSRPYSKACRYA
jgi:hypothetical protein